MADNQVAGNSGDNADRPETAVEAWSVYDNIHFYGTDANLVAEQLGLPLENKRGTVRGVPYDVMCRIPKDRLNEYADRLLELNIGMVIDGKARSAEVGSVREKLSALSDLPTLDEKYQLAASFLTDALCQNEQLLALAGTGADWQRGTGRAAVFNDGYYETLIGKYRDELLDLLGEKIWANKLENTVKGEAYRRLDAIAYDRYVLDEYADTVKAGRLETYDRRDAGLDDGESERVLVYLTEQLPDGGKHDYGYIFGYDPGDNRDHAISNYLSLIDFNNLRESVFGKPETTVTVSFRETQPVGSTVLRPLLFNDGQFNRESKRTKVEVLPPMGKYSVYAQRLSGVIGDNTSIHIATDSGYLLPLNVDRANFEKRYFEAYIDRIFEKANAQLDEALSDPAKFAYYQQAAITGRIGEAEAHNTVYKRIKNAKDNERRNEVAARQAEAEKEKKQLHAAQIQENAGIIADGGNFKVETSQYSGRNNLLELFSLYDIDVPLATKGWFNNKLVSFEANQHGGYSYRSYNNKGKRHSEMGDAAHIKLRELRKAIQAMPAIDRLAQKGLVEAPAPEPDQANSESAKDEIQETLDAFAEKHGFGKLSAEFYNEIQTKAEPQSVIIREGAEQHELCRRSLFEFAKGGKITAEHLAAYFKRLETSKAVSVVGHDDLTLYDIDIIKSRRDYQVRERQNKLGRDLDLPLPDAKNCSVGDIALIYNPGTRRSSYMKIARVENRSVILQDFASSFHTIKLSLDRFKSEQGFHLAEARTVDKSAKPDFLAKINVNKAKVERDKAVNAAAPVDYKKKDKEVD
jgi:hypothetical protein